MMRWTPALLFVALATPSAAAPRQAYDEFVIVGEVLKPEITVVISRENLNKAYELRLEERFVDKIVQSVEHDPF